MARVNQQPTRTWPWGIDSGCTENTFPLGCSSLHKTTVVKLSFCFLLPTYWQPNSPYLCTYHLHASTYLVTTYYPTYLLTNRRTYPLHDRLPKVKPAINSVGVHLQLSCKNPSNVGGSLTKHNTSIPLVGISKNIMPIVMGFYMGNAHRHGQYVFWNAMLLSLILFPVIHRWMVSTGYHVKPIF